MSQILNSNGSSVQVVAPSAKHNANRRDRPRSVIVRVEIDTDSIFDLSEACDRRGMRRVELQTRLIRWFMQSDFNLQQKLIDAESPSQETALYCSILDYLAAKPKYLSIMGVQTETAKMGSKEAPSGSIPCRSIGTEIGKQI